MLETQMDLASISWRNSMTSRPHVPLSESKHSVGAEMRRMAAAAAVVLGVACGTEGATGVPGGEFDVVEATIAQVHEAMEDGRLTSEGLVQAYLARIQAYDRQGPSLNTVVTLNDAALERARALDSIFQATGAFVGPLHGIPVVVKDNYDTADLPTSAGSASLSESVPPDDAFQVRRVREAGGIVLFKSNMAEFAFSPFETVGSALPGYSRNPYDTRRVTAGSSGGTAAAVAASFGTVGLGTDTGNSIRGPSAHQALVGIRSTMGLTSRDGIVPLYLNRDIGGPMARTVEDAVTILQVIAGYDPADPVTIGARDRDPVDYASHLDADGLQGARLGVLRSLSDRSGADPDVSRRFEEAIEDLRAAGAEIVDPAVVPELDTLSGTFFCPRFRWDLERYLETLGPEAPFRTLEEIAQSGQTHPTIRARIRNFLEFEGSPEEHPTCQQAESNGQALADGVSTVLEQGGLDALVFPTWINPPRLIGDLNTPDGNNSYQLSPPTGFPAITVPMGYVREDLPVGLQFLGAAWSEARLIELVYAYEQATLHRRPPRSTPTLP